MYKRLYATRSAYINATARMYYMLYVWVQLYPAAAVSIPTKPNSPAYGREAYAPYFVYVYIRDMRALFPERKPTAGTGGYLSAYHARQQYYTYARRSGHVPTNYRRFTYYKPKPYADMKGRANR
jgi:hypothetical protein